eukprot:TRINITY_DN11351_c0_g1_i1.p1 TRINITY_DN11351_c0_g1~~TRINITY_DN11351_c0_g1_i1.p1  ORF type:complete len:213 (-),score=32.58 TRINITY_DN11351_c0_g1_i1:21-659(-)
MDQIKLKSVEPLKEGSSRFVVPLRMTYEQNGIEKTWDMVQSHDSVGAVIFNKSTEKFVFVRQFRPPVYRHSLQNSGKDLKGYCGICFELCMGIVDDKSLSLEETTRKEILEETGFKASSLERIGSWISSVGLTGGHTTLFYTEVSEADRVSKGGGRSDEGELIEVKEISLSELKLLLHAGTVDGVTMSSPINVAFAYYWFMDHKFEAKKLKK